MNDLPGFPIDPLHAPEGAYDAVTRRARARRARTALVGGGLALALGVAGVGTAALLGGTTTDATDGLVASSGPTTPTTSTEPTAPAATATATAVGPPVSPTPSRAVGPDASPGAEVTEPPEGPEGPEGGPDYSGQVVDASGKALPGIYVWSIASSTDLPSTPADVTGADGTFTAPCGQKVLLTAWRLKGKQTASTRNLAATWLGGGRTFAQSEQTRCEADGGVVVTTMAVGGTVEGEFRYYEDGQEKPYADGANPGGGLFCDALGFTDGSGQCADWAIAGNRYRFTGLPTGTYTLLTTYTWNDGIEVRAGETTEFDWFHCLGCPQGYAGSADGEPTATPAP
jgi:hypothetical protein